MVLPNYRSLVTWLIYCSSRQVFIWSSWADKWAWMLINIPAKVALLIEENNVGVRSTGFVTCSVVSPAPATMCPSACDQWDWCAMRRFSGAVNVVIVHLYFFCIPFDEVWYLFVQKVLGACNYVMPLHSVQQSCCEVCELITLWAVCRDASALALQFIKGGYF